MSDTDRAGDGVDALAGIDPWSALEDGRAQLLRALDGLTPADAARPLADAPGWSVADLLTHVAAWDELTARFLRALAAGARELPVEAARDGDWAAWNAAHLAAAAGDAFALRVERLHAARAELLASAGALDAALFDQPFANTWGTRDTVRASLVGQAMHDAMHAETLAPLARPGEQG